MAAKYLRRRTWWARFYDPRTGELMRGLPESFCPKPRHPGNQGFDEWFSTGNTFDFGSGRLFHNGEPVSLPVAIMDVALEWIGKQAATGRPLLAVVWLSSPHGPHKAAPEGA